MDKVTKAVKLPEKVEEATPKAAPRFISGAPTTKEYTLQHPMVWDDQEYRTLTFSHLKGRHFGELGLLQAMGVTNDVAMLHLVTGTPVEVIQAMHGDDYIEAVEISENFIPSRFLGKTPSESESGQTTLQ